MATIGDEEFLEALKELDKAAKAADGRDKPGKVAVIIGSHAQPRHLDFEFINQRHVEVWGLNAIRKEWVPHWDRMFNVHRYALLKKYEWPVFEDAMWCSKHPATRFITADHWPDGRLARAEIFPRAQMAAAFPRGDYHCNSCDWLIAYALYEGFKAVHLHGWTLTRDGVMEQASARACAEYWAGYAEGRGMQVHLADDSDLFTAYHLVRSNRVYGYDDCPPYEDRVTGKDPPYTYTDGW